MTWWRSNRWYLLAVAVLLPVALFVALDAGWFRYEEGRTGRPIPAVAGETVDYAGAQWSLLESYVVDSESDRGEDAGLRPGTSLVSVTIGVRPGDPAPPCTLELVDAAGTRTWDEAGYQDGDFAPADGVEDYCSTDATDPYRVQQFFVVPDDAAEGLRLRLYSLELLPELILFPL